VDQNRFDALLGVVANLPSRRDVLRSITGAGIGLGTLGLPGIVDAKKQSKKKHKKRKRRNRNPAVDTPTLPGSVLTYQCPGPKNDDISGDGADRFAQTFTADRDGSLRQIHFSVNKKPNTTGDYLVQLLRVIGGKPSHSPTDVLAALTVPDAAVATSSDATLTATFAGPALEAGTEYAVAFSRPGSGPGGAVANTRKGDGSACGGRLFIANGAGAFNEAPAQDTLVSVLVL
jgi:hypothetical protein